MNSCQHLSDKNPSRAGITSQKIPISLWGAIKMGKFSRKQSVKLEGKKLLIQAHFEVGRKEPSSEAIDILASIFANYIERSRNNE